MLHLGRGNLFVSGSGGLGIWVVVGFGVWSLVACIAFHFGGDGGEAAEEQTGRRGSSEGEAGGRV